MNAELRKPGIDVVVRLVGAQIRPWIVPTRSLSKVLGALQRLVDQREIELEDDLTDDSDEQPNKKKAEPPLEASFFRLIAVKAGSAAYGLSAPSDPSAIVRISDTGQGIKDPQKYPWTSPTLSSLKDLSEVARVLHCEIQIYQPNAQGILAKITPSTYTNIAESALVRGHTSILGKLERVGGATATHCGLHIAGNIRMVICHVENQELVRKLGQFLYKTILVSGEATWLRHNWQLKTIRIASFEPPKEGTFQQALQEIYDAGGYAWDKVANPDKRIAEIRRA